LINKAYAHLTGEDPREGGHYITVWAPRQTGKTWVMQEVVDKIKQTGKFEVGIISMEQAKEEKEEKEVTAILIEKLQIVFARSLSPIKKIKELPRLFTKEYFQKPVILLLDEIDALEEEFINRFAGILRDMFISRTNERDKSSAEKTCLLHSAALIGVRSVLGIENLRGSPFNVQRSVHIPNLTPEEVNDLFQWYEKESGQKVQPEVVETIFRETDGQPGLTCWFGELLSEGFEGYKNDPNRPVTMKDFKIVYAAATYALPNNNILNIISKAKEEENKQKIFEMFETGEKLEFRFDDPVINALYMNGIADKEIEEHTRYYLRFACPFVQKRLFNYFSRELFNYMGRLVEPSDTLEDAISDKGLNPENIIKRYNAYLVKNREWLLKDAPGRKDMGIFEAVFHFNLYMYLYQLLKSKGADVIPQFPTGNGKINIIIRYKDRVYGIELKSYTDYSGYKTALEQAARYGQQLSLKEILLVFFVEAIDRETREKYEAQFLDKASGVKVIPIFVDTADYQ
jgi:hypothetical protein